MEKMYPLELWIGNTKIAQTQQIQEVSNNRGLVQGGNGNIIRSKKQCKVVPKHIQIHRWNRMESYHNQLISYDNPLITSRDYHAHTVTYAVMHSNVP